MVEQFKNHARLLVKDFLPENSIDCVILGYEQQQLKVLLLKWKFEGGWALPGGFIKREEDMDDAAHRILKERTGLDSIFLNQFHTFGSNARFKKNAAFQAKRVQEVLGALGIENPEFVNWINKRFITTGYFALVDIIKTRPKPDFLSEQCIWKPIDDLPDLIMDHAGIIDKAMEHLKIKLNYLPIGISLLPDQFTMPDLQRLYEGILQKKLERSNFQRKMLKLGIFIRHGKQLTGAANKAPYLYSFDTDKYKELVKDGIGFTY